MVAVFVVASQAQLVSGAGVRILVMLIIAHSNGETDKLRCPSNVVKVNTGIDCEPPKKYAWNPFENSKKL